MIPILRISFQDLAALSAAVFLSFVLSGICLPAGSLSAAVQDEATDGQKDQPNDALTPEASPALPGLRQPGDDEIFELTDESSKIAAEHTEALAWYMAGLMAQKRGDLQEAAESFSKAVAAAPESAPPVKALARILFRTGKAEEGMKNALHAIKLDKDDYETRFELAQLLAGTQNEAAAEQSVQMMDAALQSSVLDRKSRIFVGMHQFRARLMLARSKIGAAADSYDVLLQALENPDQFGLSLREHQTLQKDRSSGFEVAGRVLLEAGRTDRAISAFQAIDRIENGRPGEHHLLLARAFFMADKLPECEKNLDNYFRSGQRDNSSLLLLKDLYAATGRTSSLNERLTSLGADAADATPVRMFLAQNMLDSGNTDGAAEIYQTLLDEKGEADAYLGLMKVEIARKDATALIATMNRAVRARIQVAEFLPMTSQIVTHEDFAKKLTAACEKIKEERPGDLHASVTYFCATVATEIEQWDSEGRLLQATLELNPDRNLAIRVLNQYGVNLVRQQKHSEAARIFAQLVAIPGLTPDQRVIALYLLSEAELLNNSTDAALEAIRAAIQINDQAPRLHYQHGAILVEAGKYEEAEKVLNFVVEALPDDPDTLLRTKLQLISLYSVQSRWPDAISMYQTIIQSDKTDAETLRRCRMGLSNALVQSGDIAAGEKVLEEVYHQNPNEPGINNDLGYLYADQGKNLEQAEKMIRIAVTAEPENSAYLDSLGWVLFKLGRFDEALQELKKANSNPDYRDSTILEHQGDAHQGLNQKEEARAVWEEALRLENESPRKNEKTIQRLEEKLNNAETASGQQNP